MKPLMLFALLVLAACNPSSPVGPGPGPGPGTPPQATTPPPGTDIGNGGDHVRSTFLRVGEAVLKYLGSNPLLKNGIDLAALKAALDVNRIFVVDHPLQDNRGSDVDALGVPGKITLHRSRWVEHFEKGRDVYYLVFHEMLRSAGVPDDNYVLSERVIPFPAQYAISTRLVPLLSLVANELLSGLLNRADIKWAGSGCRIGMGKSYADFNYETNVMELSFTGYKVQVDGVATLLESRVSCSISVPVTVPAGQRLVVSQVDLTGTMALPADGTARLSFEGYRTGDFGEKVTRAYVAPQSGLNGRFQLRSNVPFGTECGVPSLLNVASSAVVPGTAGASTRFEIDRIALYLKLEPCQ